MSNKFLQELSRALRKEGLCVESMSEKGALRVSKENHTCRITKNGGIIFAAEDVNDKGCAELFHQVQPVVEQVKEYLTAMELAPFLTASGLDDAYKQLASFNGYILAGKKMEQGYGYQFATWMQDYDKKGVSLGHYFMNGYEQAKEDFVVRAGLVAREQLFTKEQLVNIYRCVRDALNYGLDVPDDVEKQCKAIQEQISLIVPDVLPQIDVLEEQERQAQLSQREPIM